MDARAIALPEPPATDSYLLRFTSLYNPGRGIAVPCDEAGLVDIDSLTQGLRTAYFFARTMIGREYSLPRVQHVH